MPAVPINPDKLKKLFPQDKHLAFCSTPECMFMSSGEFLKQLDMEGKLMWVRLSPADKTILPICPHHGTTLTLSDTVEVVNGKLL